MIASAPGKIILFGEHAVVYGKHAVVAAINLRCYVEVRKSRNFRISSPLGETSLDFEVHPYISFAVKRFCEVRRVDGAEITVESEVPIASGLGSSAAVTVATIAALNAEFDAGLERDEICEMAKAVEVDVQGRASGIDPFVSTYGGVWLFPDRKRIDCDMKFFIANLGKKSTAEMVARVAKLRDRYPEIVNPIFDAIDAVSLRAFRALEDGRVEEMEELVRINQSLLRAIGVSNHKIDAFILELEKKGVTAKITGAGGGGCVYGMLKNGEDVNLEVVSVEREGVRIESESLENRWIGNNG